MKIGTELAKEAKKHGICQEWHDQMKGSNDKDALIQMYLDGIDFCLSNDYPSNDYIRKNFKGKMEQYGIHLDEHLNALNNRYLVALGKCSGCLEMNSFNVSEVFLKHGSELKIAATDDSFIMIDQFDNSKLRLTASGNSRVCINHYGGQVQVEKSENAYVKVIEKNKNTY